MGIKYWTLMEDMKNSRSISSKSKIEKTVVLKILDNLAEFQAFWWDLPLLN